MKNKWFHFKSIYFKFAVIFLGIWWGLNSMAYGFIIRIMSRGILVEFGQDINELKQALDMARKQTGLVFLMTAIIGTVIILLAVRSIVKPIKRLSTASKEVASGNFHIELPVKSIDEVGILTSDFNKMTQELRSIDTLKKEFVDNVSHEFRTPVTSIKGFTKLLREDNFDEETRIEYCNTILAESDRLMNLSTNLLRLSQLDSQIIHEQSTFSLDDQIRDAIIFLGPGWAAKNIDFDLEMDKIMYTGDKELIWQVWINLLQNAIKFSNADGLIKVRLCSWNNGARVQISDNGIGMSKDELSRIFDRFYKGENYRNKDGNGLGLVIVKKIVESLGGTITAQSESEKGTAFTVEILDME